MPAADALARIERLLEAARRIADPADELGREARLVLPSTSLLSAAGVELALTQALETRPSAAELEQLCAGTSASARAHVVLSANVFTAAHRAIAVALAAADRVFVKASRREPHFARLLSRGAPNLFELVDALRVGSGDQVFAYGAAATLAAVRGSLPKGSLLHGHGPGFGLAALQHSEHSRFTGLAHALALDVTLFDQRGCLSPRLVLFEGPLTSARDFTRVLASALTRRELEVPPGPLQAEEQAELSHQRSALAYAGILEPAGSGFVALLEGGTTPLASLPTLGARSLIVVAVDDAAVKVREIEPQITTFAAAGSSAFVAALAAALPRARTARFGEMQRPAFDGPVDRRGLF